MMHPTFAKRLTTLPIGVVSKNNMGTLRMLLSSLECRIREAATEALARDNVPRNTKRPAMKGQSFYNIHTFNLCEINFAQ